VRKGPRGGGGTQSVPGDRVADPDGDPICLTSAATAAWTRGELAGGDRRSSPTRWTHRRTAYRCTPRLDGSNGERHRRASSRSRPLGSVPTIPDPYVKLAPTARRSRSPTRPCARRSNRSGLQAAKRQEAVCSLSPPSLEAGTFRFLERPGGDALQWDARVNATTSDRQRVVW
jgi:hypothetical protein